MQTAADAIKIRFCALGLGVVFLLIGLAGFVPSFVASPPDLSLVYAHGYLFGIFPTNHFHNAVHLLVGLWGVAAYTSLGGSITFNKVFAVLYIGLAVMGLFPYTNTLFSTMPIYGNNVWFNLLTAVIAFYYGFVKSAPFESGIGRVNSL